MLLSSSAVGAITFMGYPMLKAVAERQPPMQINPARPALNEHQSWLYQRFQLFASLDYDGEAYMTPTDFIRCASGVIVAPTPSGRRLVSDSTIVTLVKSTPSLSKSSCTFFHDLGGNGLITFKEYLFLLSLLTHPMSSLHIAFKMFDRDSNEEVDLQEFEKITAVVAGFGPTELGQIVHSVDGQTTTLTRHLFGPAGKKKLKFHEFAKFVANLQSEVLKVRFNHLSTSQPVISPIDLGRSLLKHTKTNETLTKSRLDRLAFSTALSNETIDYSAYKSLFDFIYVLDDFAEALQMFRIANRSISPAEFQRAARAVTGNTLDQVVVDMLFVLFDDNNDGHLCCSDLVEAIRSHGMNSHNPWPRGHPRIESFRRCVGRQLA